MKKILLFIFFAIIATLTFGQSEPKGMNYQAVARDLKGNVLSNKKIQLKIELSSFQSERETTYYSETHEVETSQLGLFTLTIGEGKPVKGHYTAIPWSTEDIFLTVSLMENSSEEFIKISSSRLLAVPYAYHALTASQLTDDELDTRDLERYWTVKGNILPGDYYRFGTVNCVDVVVISDDVERMRVLCNGDIQMENNLTVKTNVEVQNDLNVLGNVVLNSNIKNALPYTLVNGAFTVANRQPTYLSGTLTVDRDTWLKSRLRVDKRTDLNDSLYVNNGAPSYLTGKLTVDLSTWLRNTLRVDGITDLNAALNVNNMSPSYLSGTLTVDKNAWLKSKLRVDQSTSLNDSLTVNNMKPALLSGTLQVDQKATFKDQVVLDNASFQSNSISTGALVVNGGVGIGKNIWIGGEFHTLGPVKLESSLDVQGPANFYGNVTAHKFTELKGGLRVGGAVKLDSILTVDGMTDLKNSLNVAGTTTTRQLNANGQVTINANVGGGQGSYGAYPLRVQGSQQGIAIQLTAGTPNNDNNFIAFFDNSGSPIGAIEGQTSGEVASDPQFIFDESILVAEEIKAGVNVGLAAIPVVVAGLGASAGPCGACIAMAAADLVLASANLVAFNVFAFENLGVTYSSGSADYAEWLERTNPAEKILAGDIVGVNSGKVSKYTKQAQQLMVISTKPAILGNMPAPGTESLYEKVAFMGQIPVKVRGLVVSGDFILPSGFNDGTGIGVSPEKILPSQYKEIVGVAWSGSLNINGMSMVNMAIGLNSNDMARLAEQQEKRINELEDRFKSLEDRLLALENGKTAPERKVADPSEIQTAPQQSMSREAAAFANMPSELSDEVMTEAMEYLRNQYEKKGIDVKKHPGLYKLFNDAAFREQVIKRTQDDYKVTYQQVMAARKN